MKAVLEKICALQPRYSSANTSDMQERGRLLRNDLAAELRMRLPRLQEAFDPIFDDLSVEASDGIGRKTEAPWVRIFSRAMSPNPREGFYIVIHFAADGSAIFLTAGCGSTIWSGGDLRSLPDEELKTRTNWARVVVMKRFATLEPFPDQMSLGAKAPLPKTFEKATAIARRIAVTDIASTDIDGLLVSAAQRLGEIYLAQLDQRDVSPGDQDAEDVVLIAKPLRRTRRQGRGLTGPERRAVEKRAMEVAIQHLESQGYRCEDTSANESYDIVATNDAQQLKVEVKGTTSDICESILMTRNEVELHRREKGRTALLIVSQIKLDRNAPSLTAGGGLVEANMSWDIDTWFADPIAFQLSRKSL
jgi:hypothetical protein